MRSMGEGYFVGHLGENHLHHAIHVSHHVTSGEPDDAKAFQPEKLVAPLITRRIIAQAVGFAIDFDGEVPHRAIEIDNEWPERVLPAELETGGPLAEGLPEHVFGEAHRPPQFAGFHGGLV